MRTDRRRWVVVLVATLAYLVSFLDRLGWSGVATTAAHDFGLPVAVLGVFTSLFFVGYLVSSLLGGFVVDRFGSRRAWTSRRACACSPSASSASAGRARPGC
jgi:MFS transporter, ACS family, glucarate transporter